MGTEEISVPIARLAHSAGLPLPSYATPHSAALDLCAAIETEIRLDQGQIQLVPTGIRLAVPIGFEAQLRPRSGLAAKHGITLPNSPATIDADYRGEIMVPLINLGPSSFVVNRGMRICQLLVLPVPRVVWHETDELTETKRGEGGFGHTGH
jgi:dUTP pyrophosphatase